MIRPHVSLAKLRQLRAWEYALRFLYGGAITAFVGYIGQRYGLAVGGLCLAFPAILPASLTLVRRHGDRRDAIDDARGGRVGAAALVCFALILVATAAHWPAEVVLPLALMIWAAVAVSLWWILFARRG